MDITLERILSLIPKKPNGKYIHGAKKVFCETIGAPTNIISEWELGKTRSYRNYLYAISAHYNVSVEWLKGETDEKEKTPIGETDKGVEEFNVLFKQLPPEVQARELAYLRELVNGSNK